LAESEGALRVERLVEDLWEAELAVEDVLLSLPEDLAEEDTEGAPPLVVPDLELRVSEHEGVLSVLQLRPLTKFLLKLLDDESLDESLDEEHVDTSSLCLSVVELASKDLRDLGVEGGVSVVLENLGSFFNKLGLLDLLLLEIVGAR